MKKIQCEVCGGNDIRKTDDNIFVCQHCGIQYRSEDMSKLLVEIKDILENIDKEITEKKEPPQEAPKSQWDNCYVVDAKVAPEDNVKHFLRYLEKAEHIACDIYKEISIENTKEFYLPFFLIKGQYVVNWSAIACHVYYENEVVYIDRYNSTLGKWEKEPTTRQVERIQRTSRTGKQDCGCSSFLPASMVLKNQFGELSAEDKTNLFDAFQSQQEAKRTTDYHPQPLDQARLQKKNDCFYYGNWQILNEMDLDIANQERGNLRSRAKRIVRNRAQNDLNGGYFENYSASQSVVSEQLSFVYIPVQVITYRYKGQVYAAVSDLATLTQTVPAIYPCDQNLVQTQEQMEEKTEQANRYSGFTVLGVLSLILEGFALFFMAIIDYQKTTGLIALFSAMVISLAVTTIGLVGDAKRRKKNRQEQDSVFGEVYAIHKAALHDSKEAFFAAYPNPAAISLKFPPVGACSSALFYSVSVEDYEQNAPLDEKLLQIQQLQQEIQKLEKKRIVPIILMTVFGILIIPLFVGSILLGNVNAKLNQKRPLLEEMKAEYLES